MKVSPLFGFICVCSLLLFTSERSFAQVQDVLRAATNHFPPYEYNLNGRASGLAVDILREATKRTGTPRLEISFYPWKRAIHNTKTGKSHVLFNSGINEDRRNWGMFSKHVLVQERYFLFTLKGANLVTDFTFSNMSEKTIAIRRGFIYGHAAFKRALTTDQKFKEIRLSESTENSVRLLLTGRVDLLVGDYLPIMHYLINNDLANRIEIIRHSETGDPFNVLKWPTYFVFSKNSVSQDYVDRFDAALKSMMDDGTYQEIYQRYNLTYKLSD